MSPKYIEYDGLKFCRDEKSGYYLNSTIRKRLHRYVWEKEVGAIPKGCQIHHINKNKADNRIENLAIMTASGHQRLHWQEQERKAICRENVKKAMPEAIKWHKSEEGRKWHSQHAKSIKPKRYEMTCTACGALFAGVKNQRFCSNACKSAYRRRSGADLIPATCEICGKEFFHNKYDPTRFCSIECKGKQHAGWYQRWKEQHG